MLRRLSLLNILLVGLLGSTLGCHACSSCYDYAPPVANCDCCACGTHRSGSAWGGGCCHGGGCSTCNGGCNSGGCSNCNGDQTDGEYDRYNYQPTDAAPAQDSHMLNDRVQGSQR